MNTKNSYNEEDQTLETWTYHNGLINEEVRLEMDKQGSKIVSYCYKKKNVCLGHSLRSIKYRLPQLDVERKLNGMIIVVIQYRAVDGATFCQHSNQSDRNVTCGRQEEE